MGANISPTGFVFEPGTAFANTLTAPGQFGLPRAAAVADRILPG